MWLPLLHALERRAGTWIPACAGMTVGAKLAGSLDEGEAAGG